MPGAVGFSQPLRGYVHALPNPEPLPCVVIAHGFKGFMGWGMFPWLADQLALAGFAAVRFDFSHNGADENGDFSRLDLFAKNTLGKEQDDLDALLDAIGAGAAPFGGVCRPERIGLVGHSRGGGGAILCAARRSDVTAVVGLAAIARASRFPANMRRRAEEQGFVEIPNARTGQMMPVGAEYFRDAATRDIPAAATVMTQPLLLIHGTSDASVPIEEARQLKDAADGRPKGSDPSESVVSLESVDPSEPVSSVQLLELEGAGHTFGAVHPWAGPTDDLEEIAVRLPTFFGHQL